MTSEKDRMLQIFTKDGCRTGSQRNSFLYADKEKKLPFILKKKDIRINRNMTDWNTGGFAEKVCVSISLGSSNSAETLCDSWVLSTSVCGAGSFSTHTVTHSISESAYETQSVSAILRKPKKSKVDNLPL